MDCMILHKLTPLLTIGRKYKFHEIYIKMIQISQLNIKLQMNLCVYASIDLYQINLKFRRY